MRRPFVLWLLGLTNAAIACSGPGTQETMRGIERSAHVGAVACAMLALFGLPLRLKIATSLNLFFLALHPAWTMSPYSGDCGGMEENAVILIAMLSLGVFAWDLLRRKRDTPEESGSHH